VLSGLASGEKAKEIMKKALADKSLVPCSFVLQFYLFRALEEAGMYEKTEPLWKLWKDLIPLNCTTVPEIPGKYTRSECHAWGALILNELPRKFLGVEALEPRYGAIKIQPKGLYIGEISGRVPTPRGDVRAKWSARGGRFELEGETPVPAKVVLPDGKEHEIQAGRFTFGADI
jgi:hypothetical protein